MKELTLYRTYRATETIGRIKLSNGCNVSTLELPWRDNEIGKSCIPEGKYVVKRDRFGKHTWFNIPKVEGRTFIEIHEGYKPHHSQGCILMDVIELQDLLLDTKGEDFYLNVIKE